MEIHVTYSGFADEVCAVHVAPDTEAERPFLPDPATLTGGLLLADRGYPRVAFFEAVAAHAGSVIVRLTRSYDPSIRTAWIRGATDARPAAHPPDAVHRPARRPAPRSRRRRPRRRPRGRLPGGGPAGPRGGDDAALHHRPRTPFSPDLVGRLYRFRSQNRTVCHGVEVRRPPAAGRHGERASRRRAHLGEPVRRRPEARPRPRGPARPCGHRDVDAPSRQVRAAHPRRGGDRAPPRHRASPGAPTWLDLLTAARAARPPRTRPPRRPFTRRTHPRGARLSDHL